ncbi:MAG: hypothetical protein AAB834_03050 [Patescibacteria group bacterium]
MMRAETSYKECKTEIIARLHIQIQVIVAALAGLGVIIAQWAKISGEGQAGISLLYAMVGVYYMDNDRLIARLGAYRRHLEKTSKVLWWERHRQKYLGSMGLVVEFIASLARYVPTIGVAILFGVLAFRNHNDYKTEFTVAAVVLAMVIATELYEIYQIDNKTS